MSDRRYSIEVEGPVYQADDEGRLRLIDGSQLQPGRPFYFIPDEAAHEQGDEPVELGPEWINVGYLQADGSGVDTEVPVTPLSDNVCDLLDLPRGTVYDPAKDRGSWLNSLPPLSDRERRQLLDRKGPHRWMATEPHHPLG